MATSAQIVVTGLGVCTTLGNELEVFWSALRNGTVGTGELRHFDTSMLTSRRGGELSQLRELQAGAPEIPLAVELAVATANAAVRDAGLTPTTVDTQRAGVCFGTVMGTRPALEAWLDSPHRDARGQAAWSSPATLSRAVGSSLGFGGPNYVVSSACASGNSAIARAAEDLVHGRADAMVAGGSDELSQSMLLMFDSFRALAPDVVRPFDLHRRGLMLAEGAAALVLEREADARQRGARIHGRIMGWGNASDAHHITAPHPNGRGAVQSILGALAQADVAGCDVDFVCAHGTGTPSNDTSEARAIHSVLGSDAHHTPVSSIKGSLGHTQGAASAIEAICCLLSLRDGVVPPTANCVTPGPACDLDVVIGGARPRRLRLALNNAFGFGGNVECIVLGAP